jgi:peptidoglycan hydrolase-like protein with peptidoglycan-binding domain
MGQRDLKYGDRGDDVKALQRRLNEVLHGRFRHIPETGYFHDITRDAVRKFQHDLHIHPAYGYCGSKTRAALNIESVLIQVVTPPQPAAATTTAPASRPTPAQSQPQTPVAPSASNTAISSASDPGWTWFNVSASVQGQVQNPGLISVAAQVMPTLRLRPLPGSYFQNSDRQTHIELGLGLNYSLSSVRSTTDARHGLSIVTQGALVDPFVLGRFHSQFFIQAGMAANGIPSTTQALDWKLTHYVFQLQGGVQVSMDLIPNKWNLFFQGYGGTQDDLTAREWSGVYGGALGTQYTF